VFPQPQPGGAHRSAQCELLEHRRDHAGDGLVGMLEDLAVGIAPHQPDGQAAAQFAARGLVADAALQPGPQDMQFGLRHQPLHAQQQPVVAPGGRRRRRHRPGCRRPRPGPAADTRQRCRGPAVTPPTPVRRRPGRARPRRPGPRTRPAAPAPTRTRPGPRRSRGSATLASPTPWRGRPGRTAGRWTRCSARPGRGWTGGHTPPPSATGACR
jgi:hypothetical protein